MSDTIQPQAPPVVKERGWTCSRCSFINKASQIKWCKLCYGGPPVDIPSLQRRDPQLCPQLQRIFGGNLRIAIPVIHCVSPAQALEEVTKLLTTPSLHCQGVILSHYDYNNMDEFYPCIFRVKQQYPQLWLGLNLRHVKKDILRAFKDLDLIIGWLEMADIDALVGDWAWINELASLAEQKYAIQVDRYIHTYTLHICHAITCNLMWRAHTHAHSLFRCMNMQ